MGGVRSGPNFGTDRSQSAQKCRKRVPCSFSARPPSTAPKPSRVVCSKGRGLHPRWWDRSAWHRAWLDRLASADSELLEQRDTRTPSCREVFDAH